MRLCVHRRSKEIGGSCIELDQDGQRILFDFGLPLDVEFENAVLPEVPGLRERDPSLLGLVLSHGHRDHWSLLPKFEIPITMRAGHRTLSIMRGAAPSIPDSYTPERCGHTWPTGASRA